MSAITLCCLLVVLILQSDRAVQEHLLYVRVEAVLWLSVEEC